MSRTTVIFDFDGTLADTVEMVWRILYTIAPEFGFAPVSRHEFELIRSLTAREIMKKYRISWWQLPRILKRVRDEHHRVIRSAPCIAGVEELVRNLHAQGYRMGVLTNNREETVRAFLDHHRLDMFDFIYAARNLFGKGRALKRVIRTWEIDAREALYVGDETKDVEAAREAGMRAVAVTWGFNTKAILATHKPYALIEHPQELISVLPLVIPAKGGSRAQLHYPPNAGIQKR